MWHISIVVPVLVLAGCATANAYKMERVQIGMVKDDVVAALGRPASMGADPQSEYLYYRFSETREDAGDGITTTFFVHIMNGQVQSFGRINESQALAACERCLRKDDAPPMIVTPPPVVLPPQ
jgi:outer membrane protein assembly factor BamE (lipoprotein component of BamABCDE complex)